MPIVGQFGSLAGLGSLILPGGAFESIATVTVGSGGASSISFSSIPSDYQHLQIRLIGRLSPTYTAGEGAYVGLRFNSDSNSNYSQHQMYGNGASTFAAGVTSQTTGYLQRVATTGDTASVFGGFVADVLDCTSTSKYKTVRSFGGSDNNGSGRVYLASNLWMSTSAITSITLTAESGNFNQYSTAALFGLRAP